MESIGQFLVLVSVVVGTVSFVGLFLRLPRLWLPTRARAIRVWVASFVLLLIGFALQGLMAEVRTLLVLVSVVTGSVSFVGLFMRRPRLWFPTRTRAFLVLVASVGLFFIGSVLMAPHFQGWGGGFGIVVLESLEAQEEQEAVPLPEDPDAKPLGR